MLPDNAEAGRRDEHHSAVAFTRMPGDERMHGGGKSERARVCRHVVHAAVGQKDRAGDLLRRHIGERLAERREQARAVALPIRLAGFDRTQFEPRNALQAFGELDARRFGLRRALAEVLACALVDDEHGDRGQRLAILPGERRIGQRGDDEREGERAQQRATATGEEQQHNDDRRRGERGPQHIGGNERRE